MGVTPSTQQDPKATRPGAIFFIYCSLDGVFMRRPISRAVMFHVPNTTYDEPNKTDKQNAQQ